MLLPPQKMLLYSFLGNMLASDVRPPTAPNCGTLISWVKSADNSLGYVWRCPQHRGKKVSPKEGSFWTKSRLPLTKLVQSFWLWAHEIPMSTTVNMTNLGKPTVIRWLRFFRGACTERLLNNRRTMGGPGGVVQVYESLVAQRKNHRAHIVQERWIFWAYCPATTEGFLPTVPSRTAATLLPLIQMKITPGSIIHSDQ